MESTLDKKQTIRLWLESAKYTMRANYSKSVDEQSVVYRELKMKVETLENVLDLLEK